MISKTFWARRAVRRCRLRSPDRRLLLIFRWPLFQTSVAVLGQKHASIANGGLAVRMHNIALCSALSDPPQIAKVFFRVEAAARAD